MSTTTQEAIPESAQTYSGIPSYRFSSGAIRSGREVDGTEQVHKQIVGRIERVGVHSGETDDGRAYARVEADITTHSGKANIGVTVYDSPSTAAITFLQSLVRTKKGDVVAFEANQAKKQNKFGKFATYANLYLVDTITNKTTPIGPTEHDYNSTMDERFAALCDQLKKHDAYGERPQRDSHAGGPWEGLAAAAKDAGWPDYFDNVPAYIDWLAHIVKREVVKPDDITAEEWTMVTSKVPSLKGVPKVLSEAVAKYAATPAASTDAYDPFAEE